MRSPTLDLVALRSSRPAVTTGPDPLTPAQWRTLFSVADTFFPSIRPDDDEAADAHTSYLVSPERYRRMREDARHGFGLDHGADSDRKLDEYLAERPSDIAEFKRSVWHLLEGVTAEKRNEFIFLLNMLGSRLGSLVFTGTLTPFPDLPLQHRRQILDGWATSRLPIFGKLTTTLKLAFALDYYGTSTHLADMLAVPRFAGAANPGDGFKFQFDDEPAHQMDTDVVVVGSGCGGSVAAANLAAAGFRVTVVDKGSYFALNELPLAGRDGLNRLFEQRGMMVSDEGSISVLAGSVWGGGGTVNWSASLQTEGRVRAEWAKQSGVDWLNSSSFQTSLDRVCARMGTGTDKIVHNHSNEILLEGARKLGWAHRPVPQNTGGASHQCGSCTFGCRSGGKKGPVETFLPDAARAGAKFIRGFTVDRIQFDKSGRRAVGIIGSWLPPDAIPGAEPKMVAISARRVIVSAGALGSPVLLTRSGVTNRHIGRHLKLHPVGVVTAEFDYPTEPWRGPILSSIVSEFDNLDGHGHGAKLETMAMMPEFYLQMLPWRGGPESGVEMKVSPSRYGRTGAWISLARDGSEGRVYADADSGRVRISYPVEAVDRKSVTEGLVGLAKVLHMSGAREIFTPITCGPVWRRPGPVPTQSSVNGGQTGKTTVEAASLEWASDPAFGDFITNLRSQIETNGPNVMFMSAHQMGTCRMSNRGRSDGVVDGAGRVWGYKNLAVFDTSVFPSGSGVNPMVTCMAMSDVMSRAMAQDLLSEGGKAAYVESARL